MMVSTKSESIQTDDITNTNTNTCRTPPNINPLPNEQLGMRSEIQLEGIMKAAMKAAKVTIDGDDDMYMDPNDINYDNGLVMHGQTDTGGADFNIITKGYDEEEEE
eukprot:286953_1